MAVSLVLAQTMIGMLGDVMGTRAFAASCLEPQEPNG